MESFLSKSMHYISRGDIDAFKALLESNTIADLNQKHNGKTLLHFAIEEDQPEICEEIAKHGGDVNNKDDSNEDTPLHLAVKENSLACVEILLKHSADVNQQNRRGDTPLHVALKQDRPAIGAALLQKDTQSNFRWSTNIDLTNKKGDSSRSIITCEKNSAWKQLIDCTQPHTPERAAAESCDDHPATRFEVTDGGMTGMEGNNYQALMLILVCMRVRRLYKRFEVMTEMKAAGKFDDVVIKYYSTSDDRWHWCFIQLKHKNSAKTEKNKIELDDLRKKTKAGLQLSVYIKSLLAIRREATFANDVLDDFVVCTTANLDETAKTYFDQKRRKIEDDPILFFDDLSFQGEVHCLSNEKVPELTEENWNKDKSVSDSDLGEVCTRFRLITSYPNLLLLSELFLKSLRDEFQLKNPKIVIDLLMQQSQEIILKWRGRAITQKNVDVFLQTIRGQLHLQHCIALTEKKISEISAHEILFRASETDFDDFLKNGIHGIYFSINTEFVELTLIHVVNKVMGTSPRRDEVFVIDFENSPSNMWQRRILKALKLCKQSCCVLVHCRHQLPQEISRICSNLKLITINESPGHQNRDKELCFKNLDESTQAMIMNKEVIFQKQKKKFKEILSNEGAERLFTAQALAAILKREKIEIAKEIDVGSASPDDVIYIQRILETKVKTENDDEEHSVNHEKLWDQLIDTEAVNQHPESEYSMSYEESSFVETIFSNNEQLVTIAGEPGLGKSFLLASLKKQMQQLGHWAILINLNDFTFKKQSRCHLSKICLEDSSAAAAVSFLIEMIRDTYEATDVNDLITYKLLEMYLLSESCFFSDDFSGSRRCIILFDGFDEIAPEYEEYVFHLIKAIKQCETLQICVATRPHEQLKINEKLQAKNYNLTSFNSENQLSFFSQKCESVMEKECAVSPGDRKARNENIFALFYIISKDNDKHVGRKVALLNLLGLKEQPVGSSRSNDSLVQSFRDFIGNPLQFLMLIDVCFGSMPLTETSFNQIYQNFIDRKFDIFFEDKSHFGGSNATCDVVAKTRKDYEEQHCRLALQTLFPQHASVFEMKTEDLDRMVRVGLVTKHGPQYRFIHRSFAEYFVATALINDTMLHQNFSLIQEILLHNSCAVICTFFNDKLRSVSVTETYSQLSEEASLLWERNRSTDNALGIAAERGHTEILKYFKHILSHSIWNKLSHSFERGKTTVLDRAALSRQFMGIFKLFKKNLEKTLFKRLLKRSQKCKSWVLRTAAKSGDYHELVNFLKKFFASQSLSDLLSVKNEKNDTIAHSAAHYGTFKQFFDAIKPHFIFEHFESILLSANKSGRTIFHLGVTQDFDAVVCAVLQTLQRETLKHLLIAQDCHGWTCLHAAARHGNYEDVVVCICNHLPDFEIEKLLSIRTSKGETALDIAAYHGHFTTTATFILRTLGKEKLTALLGKEDTNEWTWLHSAAQTGKCEDVVAFIQNHLPDFPLERLLSALTKREETVLDMAARNVHFAASATLVLQVLGEQKLAGLLLKQNTEGSTCLHTAARSGNCKYVVLFIQKHLPHFPIESFFAILTKREETFLDKAAFRDHFTTAATLTLQVLGKKKLTDLLLKRDTKGWTCLHTAAARGNCENIVVFVRKHLSDFPIEEFVFELTKNGGTVLNIAVSNGHFVATASSMLKLLGEVKLTDLLLKQDTYGMTCLHSAARYGHFKDVVVFIQKHLPDFPIESFLTTPTKKEETILLMAAHRGKFTATASLILQILGEKKLTDLLLKQNTSGRTCLHRAAHTGKCEDMVTFIQKHLPDFPIETFFSMVKKQGHNILRIGMSKGHFTATANAILKALGEQKLTDLLLKQETDGWTCSHSAAKHGNCQEIAAFIQNQLPHFPMDIFLSALTEGEETILHKAAYKGQFTATASLVLRVLGGEKLTDLLLKQDTDERTCLHRAAENGHCEEVTVFIQRHLPDFQIESFFSMLTKVGHNVLHLAAESIHFTSAADTVLRVLGEEKTKDLLYEKDIDGWTCLYSAAVVGGCEDVIGFIESRLSDFPLEDFVLMPTKTDETVLHLAAEQKHFASAANSILRIVGQEKFKNLLLKRNSEGLRCYHTNAEGAPSEDVVSFLRTNFAGLEIE